MRRLGKRPSTRHGRKNKEKGQDDTWKAQKRRIPQAKLAQSTRATIARRETQRQKAAKKHTQLKRELNTNKTTDTTNSQKKPGGGSTKMHYFKRRATSLKIQATWRQEKEEKKTQKIIKNGPKLTEIHSKQWTGTQRGLFDYLNTKWRRTLTNKKGSNHYGKHNFFSFFLQRKEKAVYEADSNTEKKKTTEPIWKIFEQGKSRRTGASNASIKTHKSAKGREKKNVKVNALTTKGRVNRPTTKTNTDATQRKLTC